LTLGKNRRRERERERERRSKKKEQCGNEIDRGCVFIIKTAGRRKTESR
jgi:hypothetical protein